jgi:sulfonate transport system permease protein
MSHDTTSRLQKLQHLFQYFGLSVAIIGVWQLLFHLGYLNPLLLPPPSRIALTFRDLLESGDLLRHIGISMARVLEGFGIALFLGLTLGIAIGLSKTLDRFTDLIIQVVKPIPPIAWIPLAILWFGIGEKSKVYIIFLGAFFPIIINTIDGIRQTDHKFVEVARLLAVPRFKFVFQVVLPGALPAIMTGVRVGLMVAWICVVAAELIAASSGIGYLIMDARELSQSDVVLVGMITIGVIGKVMDGLIKLLEKRLITWKIAFSGN